MLTLIFMIDSSQFIQDGPIIWGAQLRRSSIARSQRRRPGSWSLQQCYSGLRVQIRKPEDEDSVEEAGHHANKLDALKP